jgi:hypothetical protein
MEFRRILTDSRAAFSAACVFALAAGNLPSAEARPRGEEGYGRFNRDPIMAIVAIKQQHVSIYDPSGKILQAPVSTGTTGRETPAGIFSIVQKEVDHHSNLYDDASMPYMERITWSGVALHAGVLPGYPASHGCVRMPHDFAEQLYDITNVGMRVLIVREDMAPSPFPQPSMFSQPASASEQSQTAKPNIERTSLDFGISDYEIRENLRATAEAKAAETQAAAKREKEKRQAAVKAAAEAAAALKAHSAAESAFAKAEADLKALEAAPQPSGEGPQADAAKAKADAAIAAAKARVEAARTQLETAKTQAAAKADAAAQAQEQARLAATELTHAAEASERAKLNVSPVSVFISRETQRLYIRKGYIPVYESPVTIRDADKPIGTFIFTALDYTKKPGELRWNVVSMYKDPTNVEQLESEKESDSRSKNRSAEAIPTNVSAAQAALDRLTLPQEAIDRISEVVLPGSSLIISDEGLSIETGKDTDFVVIMSHDPQGGIAMRHHDMSHKRDFDDFPFFGSDRDRSRHRGGGFFSLFGD